MVLRLSGFECEFPLVVYNARGDRIEQGTASERFIDKARSVLAHVRDANSSGVFLATGARLYSDCSKIELATPELTSPWDACRYLKAGERQLLSVAEALKCRRGMGDVVLTRCNVSYGPVPTTWGCHFSVGHQVSPESLCAQITPFLVSRQIYSGAGGFNNCCGGIVFMLSPR